MIFSKHIKWQVRSQVGRTVFVCLLTISSLSAASTEPPEFTTEGLQRVSNTQLAVVYLKPGIDMRQYSRINLQDANVAFKKNWQRNRNSTSSSRISNSDMTKIKSDLAGLFHDVFSRTLEDGGYAIVSESAEDVLFIRPG